MERHKPQTPLRFLHGSEHLHAYLSVWRTSAHNNMNEYMHCLALCFPLFSIYFQLFFKVSSLQYNRWLTVLSAWARLWACIPWCLRRSRSGTWVHGVAVCTSLNVSPSLIEGAHAPWTVMSQWCISGGNTYLGAMNPWRHSISGGDIEKEKQRINHWSTHMCSGSCEELALADGETQATDTP